MRSQISDLTLAATVASFGPTGGTPGVLPDVQNKLDTAVRTVTALGGEVQRRDAMLAQFETALRTERGSAKEVEGFFFLRDRMINIISN